MTTLIKSFYNKYTESEFQNELERLANSLPYKKYVIDSQGKLALADLSSTLEAPKATIEAHIIQLLNHGMRHHWIQTKQLLLISNICKRLGLTPASEASYPHLCAFLKSLHTLVNSQALTERLIQSVKTPREPLDGLLRLIRNAPIENQRATFNFSDQAFEWLMGYPPKSEEMDSLDEWIYDIFLLGELSLEDQAEEGKARLADLEKVGFENAFALLANAYRLAYWIQGSPSLSIQSKLEWALAGKTFVKHLLLLIRKHPQEYLKLLKTSPLPLKFDKAAVQQNFKANLLKEDEDEEESSSVISELLLLTIIGTAAASFGMTAFDRFFAR